METIPDMEEWLTSSNDAIKISLVEPSKTGLQNIATFNPKYTATMFGDEETIFGYKDFRVNLRYRANDMRPHLRTTYKSKFKPTGAQEEPTDVVEVFKEGGHLPRIAFVKGNDFEDSSKQISDAWTPPGMLHSTMIAPDATYEIWRGTLADPAIRQLNTRLQIFAPFFIDGGSYICQTENGEFDHADADRWTVFCLYQKHLSPDDVTKSSYVFVGYSTIYRFYYFNPLTPPASPREGWELPTGDLDLTELPCRTRLSQFVILPPFQGKGNGAHLYKAIFEHYHKKPQTYEFTVEDPNEAFDDMRDVCDMEFLRAMPEFENLEIDTSVTVPKSGPTPQLVVGGKDALEAIRLKAKIAPRQFARVTEMHLMSKLPDSVQLRIQPDEDDDVPIPTKADKHQERLWQLFVKQRLYRHNRDALAQIEPGERFERLQDTLGGVELEYARILKLAARASEHSRPQAANGKRKVGEEAGESASKRARVEDA